MPTRKVADLHVPCAHPEHGIPTHVFKHGHYEHECPGCGHIKPFTVAPMTRADAERKVAIWQDLVAKG